MKRNVWLKQSRQENLIYLAIWGLCKGRISACGDTSLACGGCLPSSVIGGFLANPAGVPFRGLSSGLLEH